MPTNNYYQGSQRQVSLADKAGVKTAGTGNNKKGKYSKKNKTVIAILIIIIVLAVAFIAFGIHYVYTTIMPQDDTTSVNAVEHTTTPEADKGKVSYYVLGLLGSDNTSQTEMLSVLCYDKEKKTVNILQIPQDTYLGDTTNYTVRRVSEVWGNPKPVDWCTTCRRSVPASEISDGKHTVCNTAITQMKGSSSENLCRLINAQYGLPVDGYFMIPQQALVKLVNLLGGVDVNLESSIKVNDIQYKAGVRTLDGDAALFYLTDHSSGVNGDIDRLVKGRKVFLAIFQRLTRESKEKMTNDTIGPLMNGSTPIRTDFDRTDMIALLQEMSGIKSASMTAFVIPGESAKKSGTTFYSVHKSDLLSLLKQSFNPGGLALDESKLQLTEISSKGKVDLHQQVLSSIEAPQSGAVVTTTSAGDTTTTVKK